MADTILTDLTDSPVRPALSRAHGQPGVLLTFEAPAAKVAVSMRSRDQTVVPTMCK